jgi:hypothetical protein
VSSRSLHRGALPQPLLGFRSRSRHVVGELCWCEVDFDRSRVRMSQPVTEVWGRHVIKDSGTAPGIERALGVDVGPVETLRRWTTSGRPAWESTDCGTPTRRPRPVASGLACTRSPRPSARVRLGGRVAIGLRVRIRGERPRGSGADDGGQPRRARAPAAHRCLPCPSCSCSGRPRAAAQIPRSARSGHA